MNLFGAKRGACGEPRGNPICALLGERSGEDDLPVLVDYRSLVTRIVLQTDQGCVGHALAQALRVRSVLQGGNALNPADGAIYTLGRQLEHPLLTVLPDDGCFIPLAVDGMLRYGIVSLDRWPEGTEPHLRLTEDVLEAGALALDIGVYHITSKGDERKRDIIAALSAGHPLVFQTDVDETYRAYRNGVWPGNTKAALGSHAQCIVGFTPEGCIVANSWGNGWGLGGFALIAWEWMVSDNCSNFYAVTAAPVRTT